MEYRRERKLEEVGLRGSVGEDKSITPKTWTCKAGPEGVVLSVEVRDGVGAEETQMVSL